MFLVRFISCLIDSAILNSDTFFLFFRDFTRGRTSSPATWLTIVSISLVLSFMSLSSLQNVNNHNIPILVIFKGFATSCGFAPYFLVRTGFITVF